MQVRRRLLAVELERGQRGLLPQPRLELGQHQDGLASAQLGEARGVALGAAVELVERADPRERLLGLGMIGLGFLEAAKDMDLVGGQRDPRTGARTGTVSGEGIADDCAGVLPDEVDAGRRTLVLTRQRGGRLSSATKN